MSFYTQLDPADPRMINQSDKAFQYAMSLAPKIAVAHWRVIGYFSGEGLVLFLPVSGDIEIDEALHRGTFFGMPIIMHPGPGVYIGVKA